MRFPWSSFDTQNFRNHLLVFPNVLGVMDTVVKDLDVLDLVECTPVPPAIPSEDRYHMNGLFDGLHNILIILSRQ
ncbi:hypothetical protein Tco_0619932, partial [Tanacetum coccineum]